MTSLSNIDLFFQPKHKSCAIAMLMLILAGTLHAQTPFNSWLSYEEVSVNTIDGYNTYRVFLNVDQPSAELISIYGVIDSSTTAPIAITSEGNFYQDPLGGLVASDVNPALYGIVPELEYDSYLTIGIEPGAGIVYKLGVNSSDFDENGLIIDDLIGGIVYTIPGILPEAVAGIDGKILIGQFTVSGLSSLLLNFQVVYANQTYNLIGMTLDFPTPFAGCSDPIACNFNPLATNDPLLCELPTCSNPIACNYDLSGICYSSEVCILPDGCTDPIACNFNENAVCDNGTCNYPDGCTDVGALNYDNTALCDDGSCIYTLPGCTDALACNYDSEATDDDGSCIFPDPNFNCDGDCINFDDCGNCGGSQYAGCTDPTACNFDPGAGCDDGSCLFVNASIPGCTDASAINFMPAANSNDDTCIYAGCTDPNGDNYLALYAYDDGSCVINGTPLVYGCTQPLSLNFNPVANVDQGCVFAPSDSCTGDLNNDGIVNVSDLGIFLSNLGSVCP